MDAVLDFSVARTAYVKARRFVFSDTSFSDAERPRAAIRLRKTITAYVKEGRRDAIELAKLAIADARQSVQIERSKRVAQG